MGRNVLEGPPMWLIYALVGQVAVLWMSAQGQSACDGIVGGVPHGAHCYIFSASATNWTDAENNCSSQGGRLASVPDDSTHTFLSGQLSQRAWTSAWLAGTELHGSWRWIKDEEHIRPQGCFTDKSFDRDLQTEIIPAISDLTPSKCIEACNNRSMLYAGVQNQLSCFCGNTFGKYGRTEGCTVKCEVTKTEYCGGFGRNFIYQIGASYAKWATGQPNDKGGYQSCATIDYRVADGDFSDETCSVSYYYICTVDDTTCNAADRELRNGVCYVISSAAVSWFAARADCVSKSGELLKVSNASIHADIKAILTARNAFDKYWVGLVSGIWKWSSANGQDSPIVYNRWANNYPSKRSATCLKLQDAGSNTFNWVDASCIESHNYICQLDPLTTTTTTSTTTTTPTTTSPTSTSSVTTISLTTTTNDTSTASSSIAQSTGATVTPSSPADSTTDRNTTNDLSSPLSATSTVSSIAPNSSDQTVTSPSVSSASPDVTSSTLSTTGVDVTLEGPNTGGSTQNGGSGLSSVHIVLIVCFALLAVAIVTGSILFVYYKKRHRKSKVSPYSKDDVVANTDDNKVELGETAVEDAAGLAVTNASAFDRVGPHDAANGSVRNGNVVSVDVRNGHLGGSVRHSRRTWHGDRIVIEE